MVGFRAIWALVIANLLAPMALADPFVQLNEETLYICDVQDVQAPPPDRTSPACRPAQIAEIDPKSRALWVLGSITPNPEVMRSDRPIGLFVAVKAASRVYLNGRPLGQNGVPALSKAEERPGRIDAVFHVSRDQLLAEDNTVAVLMSGHHQILDTHRPVLLLGLFAYLEPPYHERDTLWLAAATLGLFLVAGLYAAILAGLRLTVLAAAPLALTCAFAGGQVVAEALRSVWSYPYPIHDLRLMAITVCGFGTGMTLAVHVANRLEVTHKWAVLVIIAVVTLLAIGTANGFDATASRAILVPNALTALLAAWQARKGLHTANLYAAGLLVFVVLNLVDPGEFLDVNYFLALSALVLFLTVLQALAYRSAVLDHADADRRRRQLEQALERATSETAPTLTLRHAGRIDKVALSEIISLQAAGDYVVILLTDGRELVPTTSLAGLEKDLPERFVRVHRSHMVNTDYITALNRHRDRTGELILRNGQRIPVSRRVMPGLRKALTGQEESGARAAPQVVRDRP